MAFGKRKMSGKEVSEQRNRDGHKAEWLQKVLSPKEFTDFVLAQGASRVYQTLLEDKEPNKERSPEMNKIMSEFRDRVKNIVKNHDQVEISQRDQQVEELIRQAEFMDDYKHSPSIYYYFRTLSDDGRREWDKKMDQIDQEIYGIDFSIFDD